MKYGKCRCGGQSGVSIGLGEPALDSATIESSQHYEWERLHLGGHLFFHDIIECVLRHRAGINDYRK